MIATGAFEADEKAASQRGASAAKRRKRLMGKRGRKQSVGKKVDGQGASSVFGALTTRILSMGGKLDDLEQ